FGAGGDFELAVRAQLPGSQSWLLGIDAKTGAILDQRTVNSSSALTGGAVTGGNVYFLGNSSNGLAIDGINASSGTNLTVIPVRNVADNSTDSAELFAVGGLLIVASYSPSLSYAAYDTAGTLLWQSSFPDATSCGQPDFEALGPCATDLSAPHLLGNDSVLLSSCASLEGTGNTYVDTYRLVAMQSGAVEWAATYSYTFGSQTWPWENPVPSFSIQNTVETYVIYAVVSPDSTTVSGGTT
ncbi:MAG: hypothetical protein L3K01_07840, partial [Thermoplasmata archaeon]|nr:hypothetical protein [Thermoplasmata archaeon]